MGWGDGTDPARGILEGPTAQGAMVSRNSVLVMAGSARKWSSWANSPCADRRRGSILSLAGGTGLMDRVCAARWRQLGVVGQLCVNQLQAFLRQAGAELAGDVAVQLLWQSCRLVVIGDQAVVECCRTGESGGAAHDRYGIGEGLGKDDSVGRQLV